MKKVLLEILAVLAIVGLVACSNETKENQSSQETKNEAVETINENIEQEVPKNEQIGTAGSNIPLKDNHDEAENQIKIAMQNLIKEMYGDEVTEAKIDVQKIYTAKEEQEEPLKSYNLGIDEVAFEVKYELKIAEGVKDTMKFTAATGEYDEESGWVKEKYNLGILRPDDSGKAQYIITDFGTGW